jgi:nucleotide-binding universal stress UspA family protein
MNTLLVPVDGSEHSKKAFKLALAMAKGQDTEIVLLNVQPSYKTPNVKRFLSQQQVREYQQELSKEAFDKVFSDPPEMDGVKISRKFRLGDPGMEICKEAKEINASVIVMGNRGLGAIRTAVLGSL